MRCACAVRINESAPYAQIEQRYDKSKNKQRSEGAAAAASQRRGGGGGDDAGKLTRQFKHL